MSRSFCINYIIGVGILAVPYAFTQAGPVLASMFVSLSVFRGYDGAVIFVLSISANLCLILSVT